MLATLFWVITIMCGGEDQLAGWEQIAVQTTGERRRLVIRNIVEIVIENNRLSVVRCEKFSVGVRLLDFNDLPGGGL